MNMQFMLVMVLWQLTITTKDFVPEAHLESFYQEHDQSLNSQEKLTPLMGVSKALLSAKSMSQTEYQQLCKSAQEHDFYCRTNYGMNSRSFEHLMYKNPDEFVNTILSNPYLSDVARIELWDIYKYRQGYDGWHEKKVASQTNRINAALKKNENERNDLLRKQQAAHDQAQQENQARQLKQQALFKLSQKYPASILQNSNYVSPHQTHRKEALAQTVKTGYVKHEQTHEIDAQTAGMLEAQCIDHRQFQSLSGTIFQHQLFHEIAGCYKKIAKVTFEHGLKNSLLTPHVLQFAQTSFAANQLELAGLSVQLNDIADFLAETSLSACKGVIESVCNLGDMIWNYQETAASLGRLLHGILCVLGGALQRYNLDSALLVQDCVFEQDKQHFHQLCDAAKIIYTHAANNGTQENIQTISRLATDIIATPVIIGHVGRACLGLISHARELRALENITAISEDLGFAYEIIEETMQESLRADKLITTTGKLSSELNESLINLIEVEINNIVVTQANKALKAIKPFQDIVQIIKQRGAPSNDLMFQKEVLIHFNDKFCKEKLLELCKKAKELYGHVTIIEKFQEIEIICDIEHILTYNLKFKKNYKTGLIDGFISGGHFGGILHELKAAENITILTEELLPGGARYVEYEHLFGSNIAKKTEYPLHWTGEKIMQANIEAYLNFTQETALGNNVFSRKGLSGDGLEVVILYQKESEAKIKIVTAYPYYKKLSVFK